MLINQRIMDIYNSLPCCNHSKRKQIMSQIKRLTVYAKIINGQLDAPLSSSISNCINSIK